MSKSGQSNSRRKPVEAAAAAPRDDTVPVFTFILQPEFPLNALVLASEALRIANQNRGRDLFRWSFVSESGEPIRASNGMWMSVDCALATMPTAAYLLVFEGNLPTQRNSPALLAQLRKAARYGATVGAIDTGAFALAQAGIAGEGKVVLHWEAAPTFRERFRKVGTRDQIFLLDGRRAYAAGGVATLDLMLEIIARHYGQALANEVANALVHTPRPATAPQRIAAPDSGDGRKTGPAAASERIVPLMEQNLDFPLGLEGIAEELGVSARTVTRECLRRFNETPMRLYLRIRLQAARNFLFYEEFSIKDVAVACGFSYPSVFSRAFRQQFDQTPRAFRTAFRMKQAQAYRPEIRRLTRVPQGG